MKYRIEIEVPDNIDPSTLLAEAQEFAIGLFADYPDEDDDGEAIDLSEDEKEVIRNDVSVEEVTNANCPRCGEGTAITICAKCTAYL